MTRAKTSRSGFGLIEILVVIVIISILAVILIPRLTGGGKDAVGRKVPAPRERAQQVAGSAYVAQINQAISMYRMDNDGQNPQSLQDLKRYGVTDEMLVDQVTKQPLPYDPTMGTLRLPGGGSGGGAGGTGLPQVPGF